MDAFERAQQFVTVGDYESAKSEYGLIIDSEPDNSAAWYGMGVVEHARGNISAAINAFERAFLLNRHHAPTSANLAFLFAERDAEEAAKYAKAAIDLGLENDNLEDLAAAVDGDQSDIEEEPPMLVAESIPVVPDSIDIRDEISNLIDEEEYQLAMEKISPALEGDHSSDPMIWYYCGLCLHALNLSEDAIQSLNYALLLNPELKLAESLVAEVVEELSEPETGIVEFTPNATEEVTYADFTPEEEEEVEISLEDTLVVLQQKAKKYSEEGDHALSIKTWKKIIEDYGSTYDSWYGMSKALEAAGHIEKANQCRKKAEELQSTLSSKSSTVPDVDLIAAAIEAKESVSQNSSIDEDSVNVAIEWYNKGLTLLAEDKGDQALNCFDKAISSTPRDERELRVRTYNGRGHALHQLGKFSESIQSYHQAISMDPTMVTGRTLYNMGSSYAAMEHFSDAIKCFEQALSRKLEEEEKRLVQTQMNRCSLLLKEQMKASKIQS
ncbi:MAG: tetratricopeptide repeat protein [Euryarchaeota archaeon]